MTDITTVVNTYIAAWNETDGERRRELVARTWTEDGTYLDPLMAGEGVDAIAAMIGGAQQRFPGHRFELAFGPDVHHDHARFAWRLLAPNGGGTVVGGVDFAALAEDGRMRTVTGFLEPTG